MSTAKKVFKENIVKELGQKLEIKNLMAVPKLEKIVINVGIGKTRENPKFKDSAIESLKSITGQKPKITRAKKAIAGFKIRQNDEIGLVVTLRDEKMYDFANKLASIVLPRMRDFRGLKDEGFDKAGNFTLAIQEQLIFPEISHEKSEIVHGMSITFVTTAKDFSQGKALMEALGFPFNKKD
ncbi:MAG: 50S ribosomal protein L5 [Patescibacteria group bacterium]